MNMEEFLDRVCDGEMKAGDIPVLAVLIVCALAVVIGEIGCVVWFFGILISALCDGAARLLMLIPDGCLKAFSTLIHIKRKVDTDERQKTKNVDLRYGDCGIDYEF